jgi:hypothetical protein
MIKYLGKHILKHILKGSQNENKAFLPFIDAGSLPWLCIARVV